MAQQEGVRRDSSGGAGITHPEADLHHGRMIDEFKKGLAADRKGAYGQWGYTWLHSMSDEEAAAEREALGFKPADALDHYNHGCLLASREQYAPAAAAFAKAAELDPALADAAFNHATALDMAGKKSDARAAYKNWLEKHPGASEDDIKTAKDRMATLAE